MDFLKKLFCNHIWILDRQINDKGLYQCYCKNCHKIEIKKTRGDIEH